MYYPMKLAHPLVFERCWAFPVVRHKWNGLAFVSVILLVVFHLPWTQEVIGTMVNYCFPFAMLPQKLVQRDAAPSGPSSGLLKIPGFLPLTSIQI